MKQCLSKIDFGRCAEAMLEVVHAALSEGQGHISEDFFQKALSDAILNHVYNIFLEKINVSLENVS